MQKLSSEIIYTNICIQIKLCLVFHTLLMFVNKSKWYCRK